LTLSQINSVISTGASHSGRSGETLRQAQGKPCVSARVEESAFFYWKLLRSLKARVLRKTNTSRTRGFFFPKWDRKVAFYFRGLDGFSSADASKDIVDVV